jgi:hypothetical protein
MSHENLPTSAEVWAVLKARHHSELQVYSSFSDPEGSMSGRARMETEYCLPGADYPLMGARTVWDIECGSHKRLNEQHEYWLCVPIKDQP